MGGGEVGGGVVGGGVLGGGGEGSGLKGSAEAVGAAREMEGSSEGEGEDFVAKGAILDLVERAGEGGGRSEAEATADLAGWRARFRRVGRGGGGPWERHSAV